MSFSSKRSNNSKSRLVLVFVVVFSILIGCVGKPSVPTAGKESVVCDLMDRRRRFSVIEADVNFRFPEGVLFASSLEGHAVYKTGENGPMLRLVTFGPMGVQALDLLVKNGDFLVMVPGRKEPMSRRDLCEIYGDNTLTQIPSLLARIPGLFFGGVPDELSHDWEFRRDAGNTWLTSLDGYDFLIVGMPPVIRKVVIANSDIGKIVVEMENWEESSGGLFPIKATTKFDKRTLFSFKIRSFNIGPSLPDDVFIMGAHSRTPLRKLLKIKAI